MASAGGERRAVEMADDLTDDRPAVLAIGLVEALVRLVDERLAIDSDRRRAEPCIDRR